MIAAGACSAPTASSTMSAVTPPRKASAMPWRAGHMPLSRNQPAAVTAWSSTSGTSRAYGPTAPRGEQQREPGGQGGGCIPGAMIGDRPSARARWEAVSGASPVRAEPEARGRALPRVVGALYAAWPVERDAAAGAAAGAGAGRGRYAAAG